MLLPFLALFDFGSVRANFKKPFDLDRVTSRSTDFAMLVPIYGSIEHLKNISFLARYADNVILCTTASESPEFVADLKRLSAEYGFRISYTEVQPSRRNPWALYHKALIAHDAVLRGTAVDLKEKYVIFVDGDTYVDDDIGLLCGAMEESGFDIASVKVLPASRSNPIEKLQGVEYDIAMQSRLIYPWLTSGAGMVAKRGAIIEIMKNHSLFFNGGDIEIGKLADLMGYKVGHLPMVFYTDIPSTTWRWVKQRSSWMCGCFRHSVVNMQHNLNHPFHFIYFSFIIYFLLPFKIYEMTRHWYLIPFVIAIYVIVTYLANWRVRSRWMIVFPFYALFQIMVILWLGVWRYLVTICRTGNPGRIRLRSETGKVRTRYRSIHKLYNAAVILTIVSGIVFLMSSSAQAALLGRSLELLRLPRSLVHVEAGVTWLLIGTGVLVLGGLIAWFMRNAITFGLRSVPALRLAALAGVAASTTAGAATTGQGGFLRVGRPRPSATAANQQPLSPQEMVYVHLLVCLEGRHSF